MAHLHRSVVAGKRRQAKSKDLVHYQQHNQDLRIERGGGARGGQGGAAAGPRRRGDRSGAARGAQERRAVGQLAQLKHEHEHEDIRKALGANRDPEHRKEAIGVNASLTALPTAIQNLANGQSPSYRSSRPTMQASTCRRVWRSR